jgi:hypothetical protein
MKKGDDTPIFASLARSTDQPKVERDTVVEQVKTRTRKPSRDQDQMDDSVSAEIKAKARIGKMPKSDQKKSNVGSVLVAAAAAVAQAAQIQEVPFSANDTSQAMEPCKPIASKSVVTTNSLEAMSSPVLENDSTPAVRLKNPKKKKNPELKLEASKKAREDAGAKI